MKDDTAFILAAIFFVCCALAGIIYGGIQKDKQLHEQALACINSGGSPISNRTVIFCVR